MTLMKVTDISKNGYPSDSWASYWNCFNVG